jgi:hypothetical protein
MNTISVIYPYRDRDLWVFDDDRVGLVREPFVAGADTLLDRMAASIPDAPQGVTVLFSAQPFPGCQHELVRKREEYGGHWYFSAEFGLEGWLCPALFHYFEVAPERLYIQVKSGQTSSSGSTV